MPPSGQIQKRSKPKSRVPIPLLFVALSVACIMGLDYINWKTGEPSAVFSRVQRPKPAEKEPEKPIPLAPRLAEFAAGRKMPGLAVSRETDEAGSPRIALRLPPSELDRAESTLRRELGRQGGTIVRRVKEETASDLMIVWRVEAPAGEKFSVLFSCPLEKAGVAVKPETKGKAAKPEPRHQAAIIIDDLGNDQEVVREISSLGAPITVSILPEGRFVQETAEMAHRAGLEIMLHVPTESLNHQEEQNPGDVIIRSGMGPEETRKIMEDFLGRVPYIVGVNNHMGSKATQDEALMRGMLGPIRERGLFFLDSRTFDRSIAYELARDMGIRSAYRNIFLDSIQDGTTIKNRILDLFQLARKRSPAVGIGHPFRETLSALKEMLPLAEKYGVELIFASHLFPKQ